LASSAGEGSKLAAALHDSLERYFGGTVDREAALRSLIPGVNAGFAALLSRIPDEGALAGSIEAILAQRTTRHQLADALALVAEGQPVPKDWEIFGSLLGAELHKALSVHDWRRQVRAGRNGMTFCAFDYYAFSRHDAAAYARQRVARCVYCKRFTVNVDS